MPWCCHVSNFRSLGLAGRGAGGDPGSCFRLGDILDEGEVVRFLEDARRMPVMLVGGCPGVGGLPRPPGKAPDRESAGF